MSTPFSGELTIILLIIICLSRMFFLKYGKIDTLTFLSPVCIVLSILQIAAWNADIFSILILIISVLSFFTNFRAFQRFISGLYVDHYSIAYKSGAFILLILSAAVFAALIIFRPAKLKSSDFNSSITKIKLSGNVKSGFRKAGTFEKSTGIVSVIQPSKPEDFKKNNIIIITDKRADAIDYYPYALKLSEKGYRVFIGEFYSNDIKWFHNVKDWRAFRKISMLLSYFNNKVRFESQKEFYSYNSSLELDAMIKFVRENADYSEQVFIVSDWMSDIAVSDFAKENESIVSGLLKLSDLNEYKTKGFGLVENTVPVEALKLGVKPSSNFETAEKMAEDTIAFIPVYLDEEEMEVSDSEKSDKGAEK